MPKSKSKESLKEIYTLIVESLETTTPKITEVMQHYRTINYHNWSNNDFLETMAQVIFAAVPPSDWETLVEPKWEAIKRAFACFDVDKVASYTENDVKQLKKTPNIIHNMRNIKGIIKNAKQMQEIIKEYGSFANYVCFYPYDLKKDLLDRFYGLGEKTVLDFMKEMGFPVVKDDIHIRRVFCRLDLTNSEDVKQKEILSIAKEIAEAVGEKMPVIDCVLWSFGHYVCKAKPYCEKCLIEVCNSRH